MGAVFVGGARTKYTGQEVMNFFRPHLVKRLFAPMIYYWHGTQSYRRNGDSPTLLPRWRSPMGTCFRAGPTPQLRRLPRKRRAGTQAPRAENVSMPTLNGPYILRTSSSGSGYGSHRGCPFPRRRLILLRTRSSPQVLGLFAKAVVVGERLGIYVRPWTQHPRLPHPSIYFFGRLLAHEGACHGAGPSPLPPWRDPVG